MLLHCSRVIHFRFRYSVKNKSQSASHFKARYVVHPKKNILDSVCRLHKRCLESLAQFLFLHSWINLIKYCLRRSICVKGLYDKVDQGLDSCSTASPRLAHHPTRPPHVSEAKEAKYGKVKHFSAFFPDCPLLCPKYSGFPLS